MKADKRESDQFKSSVLASCFLNRVICVPARRKVCSLGSAEVAGGLRR